MGDYGSEIDRINDLIKQSKTDASSGLGNEIANAQSLATENWNSKNADYTAKYGHLAEGGGAEIAGAFGLKGIFKGAQKLQSLYQKHKAQTSEGTTEQPLTEQTAANNPTAEDAQAPDNLPAEDVPDVPNVVADAPPDLDLSGPPVDAAAGPLDNVGAESMTRVGNAGRGATEEEGLTQADTTAPTGEGAGGDLFDAYPRIGANNPASDVGRPPIEDLDAPAAEGAGEGAAAGAAEGAAAGAGETAAATGLGDIVAAGIPVVGEGLLAVAGLVSIGEGLYHLFHHKTTQPTITTAPTGGIAPPSQTLTKKFALSIPSIDSAADQPASVSSF
mgnify:CR=1 FL=1